jgi:EpsI family protein
MITNPKRASVLLAVVAFGFSLIFMLPKGLSHQPLGVVDMTEMPEYVGAWRGKDLPVTKKERETLGPDTDFARKAYSRLSNYRGKKGEIPSEYAEVTLSVVLSGQDMNTSIHRAERCLPTQGWNIADKREVAMNLPGRGSFTATRLYNTKPVQDKSGRTDTARMLSYYWFIGHTETTGSHFERTFIDMKDRLISGYNQRWAYITVTVVVPPAMDSAKQSEVEQTVDEMLREFIVTFSPKAVKETVKLR